MLFLQMLFFDPRESACVLTATVTVASSTKEFVAKNPCSYSPTYRVGLKNINEYISKFSRLH